MSTCECGKAAYTSPARARQSVRGMGNSISVYLCPVGHVYHVTKSRGNTELSRKGRGKRAR